jgi:hypothetical protein
MDYVVEKGIPFLGLCRLSYGKRDGGLELLLELEIWVLEVCEDSGHL